MFGFLDGVPAPELCHGRGSPFHPFGVTQDGVGQYRRVMLGTAGARQLPARRKFANPRHMLLEPPVEGIDIIAPRLQSFVVALVLPAVQRLLAYKAANFRFQLGILNLVPIESHGINELLFAIRELQGKGIEKRGPEGIVAVPERFQIFTHIEPHVSRLNRHPLWRGADGHGGLLSSAFCSMCFSPRMFFDQICECNSA